MTNSSIRRSKRSRANSSGDVQVAGVSSEYSDETKALASLDRFPLAMLVTGYFDPRVSFSGEYRFGGIPLFALGGFIKEGLEDKSSNPLPVSSSHFVAAIPPNPPSSLVFLWTSPALLLPMAAAALPPSSLAVFPLCLCPSFHHSGYPTILKHCSLVCFDIPQWLHFNCDLSGRDDDPFVLPVWSDLRLPFEMSPKPSASLGPVTAKPAATPCCDEAVPETAPRIFW
nr:hypothetical protein Itr_chr04CG19880 [Ipomoea trifida]